MRGPVTFLRLRRISRRYRDRGERGPNFSSSNARVSLDPPSRAIGGEPGTLFF